MIKDHQFGSIFYFDLLLEVVCCSIPIFIHNVLTNNLVGDKERALSIQQITLLLLKKYEYYI